MIALEHLQNLRGVAADLQASSSGLHQVAKQDGSAPFRRLAAVLRVQPSAQAALFARCRKALQHCLPQHRLQVPELGVPAAQQRLNEYCDPSWCSACSTRPSSNAEASSAKRCTQDCWSSPFPQQRNGEEVWQLCKSIWRAQVHCLAGEAD